LTWLIHKLFTGTAKGQHLAIGRDKAYFTKENKTRTYDMLTTILLMEDVIDNAYVLFADTNCRQQVGVPMGAACSPMMADLTLTVMEHRYVMSASKTRQNELKHVWRYIDDILAINCPNFEHIAKEIYPPELILKRADDPNKTMVPFLDLHINRQSIENIDLYDKTKDFSFQVVKFTDTSANIPPNTIYDIFHSQLVRISRIIQNVNTWHVRVLELIKACINAGAMKDKLAQKLAHFMRKYDNLLWKYGIYTNEHRTIYAKEIMEKA
jgi:hypothetical protein